MKQITEDYASLEIAKHFVEFYEKGKADAKKLGEEIARRWNEYKQ